MIAAVARAYHLLSYGPRAPLSDWLAWPFVGAEAEPLLDGVRTALGNVADPFFAWLGMRYRISEDWLGASEAGQYVILGAGLDSFAWRQDSGVRVFEVDLPATQAWKRSRVESLGLVVPRWAGVGACRL